MALQELYDKTLDSVKYLWRHNYWFLQDQHPHFKTPFFVSMVKLNLTLALLVATFVLPW